MKNSIKIITLWFCSTLNIVAQDFSGFANNPNIGAPVYVYGDVTVKVAPQSSVQNLSQTMQRVHADLRANSDQVWAKAAASRTQMLINEQNFLLRKVATP